MKTIAPDFRHFLLRASFLLGLAACSDADETSPPATTGTDTGSTSGTHSDATATASTSSDSTTSSADSSKTDIPTGDCAGENGCFSCPPTTSKQLTNACTDAQCQPFPITKERLPLLNDDGSLPPLP